MSRDTMLEIALSAENDLLREVMRAANKLLEETKAKNTSILAPSRVVAAFNELDTALKRWNDWSANEQTP